MFLGDFSASLLLKVPFFVVLATLPVIYYISQYYHHEKPFPHCWISAVAQHYPEFIFFRFATISGPVLIIVGILANHFYLQTIAKEKVFNLRKYYPQVTVITGIMGGLFLMGSTATIDTGIMEGKWHTFCASKFFIFTLVAQIYNTYVGWAIYSNIKALSFKVLIFKTLIIGLLIFQLYLSAKYGMSGAFGEYNNQIGNDWDKFLEWTLTATVLSGYYAMALDVEGFDFVYEKHPTIENSN